MARGKTSDVANVAEEYGLGIIAWAVFVVLLVIGGLLLAARAADAYMAASGLLFAGFGVLLGFRLMRRMLP